MMPSPSKPKFAPNTMVVMLLVTLFAAYSYGAFQNARHVNTDLTRTDQGSFMKIARRMYDSGLKFSGYRNQMPAYPFVQLLSYKPSLGEEEFFERGKTLNIGLSVLFLAVFWGIFSRYFPLHHALNLLAVTAFSVFIFKAGYFHCSLLYYFLSFLAFLLTIRLLSRPSPTVSAITGILMGLAYLTKASFLAGAFLGLFVLFLKSLHSTVRRSAAFTKQWIALGLTALFFFGTIFFYITENKREYGRYFYNVNTSFYMWYKTREEIFSGQSTRAHDDRKGWPTLPDDKIPGPIKYLKENSVSGVLNRLFDGYRRMTAHMMGSFGFFKYVMLYAGLALGAAVRCRHKSIELVKTHPYQTLFVFLYLAAYLNLYAFYMATGPIIRHILSLFLPVLFILSLVALRAGKDICMPGFRKLSLVQCFNWMITLILVPDIYGVLTDKVFRIFGAD